METEKYTFDSEKLKLYLNFLKKHYTNDKRIVHHIKQVAQQLSEDNPFYLHGRAQNFLLKNDSGEVVGHCSAVIDNRNKNTGLIGFYDCIDDIIASEMLLDEAVRWLKENECLFIEGPVNLTIWNNYRFITDSKKNLNIFDPFNKDYYPTQWKNFGFTPVEEYVSAIRYDFDYVLKHTKQIYDKLLNLNFYLRKIDLTNIDSELELLKNLANKIFNNSRNFVKLSYEEFKWSYSEILQLIDKNYIEFITTKEGKEIGFCFSISNPHQKNQLIMKTIGVLPQFQKLGAGAVLLHSQHEKARDNCYKEYYYSLIRVGNNVTKLPYEGYEVITRYETYKLDK